MHPPIHSRDLLLVLLLVLLPPALDAADLALPDSSLAPSSDIVETDIYDVYSVRIGEREDFVAYLHDPAGRRFLQVWIGPCEATAISRKLHDQEFPRPLTHDLFATVLEDAGIIMKSVIIDQLRPIGSGASAGTFFAVITFQKPDGTELTVDSRTSDAMALAARTGATIYAARRILDDNGIPESDGPPALGIPRPSAEKEEPESGFY